MAYTHRAGFEIWRGPILSSPNHQSIAYAAHRAKHYPPVCNHGYGGEADYPGGEAIYPGGEADVTPTSPRDLRHGANISNAPS